MSLDRERESAILDQLKTQLLKQFQQCVESDSCEAEEITAETAHAYATIVQTQLALENLIE